MAQFIKQMNLPPTEFYLGIRVWKGWGRGNWKPFTTSTNSSNNKTTCNYFTHFKTDLFFFLGGGGGGGEAVLCPEAE